MNTTIEGNALGFVPNNQGTVNITFASNTPPVGTPIDPALEEHYLNWLMATAGKVSLLSIDPKAQSEEATPQAQLEAIYTALLTRSSDQKERDMTGESKPLSALAMLERHPHLVLLGRPGSGKSTFVNFVVVCLAGERLNHPQANLSKLCAPLPDKDGKDEAKAQPWTHGGLLPLRVILREFASQGLPAPGQKGKVEHLWQFLRDSLPKYPKREVVDYLRDQFFKHGGLILLDGLDEVPEVQDRRIQIKQVIQELVAVLPKCRILVTSRTYAYQPSDDWKLPNFAETELAFFSTGQVRRFADSWHRYMGENLNWPPNESQARADHFKQVIFRNEYLRDLAQRPLLLTLMCLLHTHHGSELPEKRAELYEQTVDLLLHRWERRLKEVPGYVAGQPSLSEWLRVSKEAVRNVLNRLAHDVHMAQAEPQGTANIKGQDLMHRLLALGKDDPDIRPARLQEYLDHRAGILLPLGHDVFTFPHRTFQEYLAACYLTNTDNFYEDMADLVRQAPNRWREVALLAGAKQAQGGAANIWTLVEALCPDPPPMPSPNPLPKGEGKNSLPLGEGWGGGQDMIPAIVAAEHIIETANLQELGRKGQKFVPQVKAWLKYIIQTTPSLDARERATAGQLLGKLGDDRPGVGLKDGLPDIVWQTVPAGPFIMGSNNGLDDEKPEHTVTIPYDYRISRYPVTQAQYQAFVDDGGYTEKWFACWTVDGWQWREKEKRTAPRSYGLPFYLPNHPIVGVTWYEAVAFCNWLTVRLRARTSEVLTIKLPSEAEWEKAARAEFDPKTLKVLETFRVYPWGNEADPDKANYNKTGIGATSAVSCFPGGASPCGAMDMAGNVWEWCSSEYKPYPYQADDGREDLMELNDIKVLRGSGWISDGDYVSVSFRNNGGSNTQYYDIGYRCVRL